jgi:hypothetical protein
LQSSDWGAAAGFQIDLTNHTFTVRGALQIDASGGVNLSTGADITLNFTDSATAWIYWDGGALGDMYLGGSSRTQMSAPYTEHPTLELYSVTDGLGYLELGGTSNYRWYYILLGATNSIALRAGTTLLLQSSGALLDNDLYIIGNLTIYDASSNYFTVEKIYAGGAHSIQFTSSNNADFCMRIDMTNGTIWISTNYTAGTPTWTEH